MKPKGFQKLTSADEALQTWITTLQIGKPKIVAVPLQDALGRILSGDLVALESLPRFDRSAMDGYAVKSADTTSATQSEPVTFELTENTEIADRQAKQVWTGNPIPKGADAVVIIEDTERHENRVEVFDQVSFGINVAKIGEDIEKGTVIAKAGKRLNPYHIGLAAALGYTQLYVYAKPKIGILATGNELAEIGTKLTGSLIYDSNGRMFSDICRELGAETTDYGLAKDNVGEIASKIQEALKTMDAVITTGGTSVGGLDLVPDVVDKLGKPGVIVHGVAIRPGMPTAVAMLEGKPVLVLSGNPVAAIIGFEVFGRPMVCKLLGMDKTEPRPILKAALSRKVTDAVGRRTYLRVHVVLRGGKFIAEPVSTKGPGSISTMTQSNGYAVISEDRDSLDEGEEVLVNMFDSVEVEN